ncbi:MAG: exodeoxyribonuclease VII large subunit [Holophagales bacterium]|nr:exodeoxyribonuclease VII large subunit [Holophagales bacterium]
MTFADEPTYSVSELTEEIREVLRESFRGFWVRGEVHRPRSSARGHLYFEMVEKGAGDEIVGKVDAVMWRSDHQRVRRQLERTDQRLADGLAVRCFGSIDFYGPAGRLQLVVREVDPAFGLGALERRRRETLQALERLGLVERNRSLELSELPLSVGLISSEGSAAYHDFLTTLGESGYGFRVHFVHASVQGPNAERELSSALELLGEAGAAALDAVVVVRGGGARTDLAAFDSRAVAEAVARCPLPVVCGLGHEIDRTISDLVCHTAVKTPTGAAEMLVARVAESHLRWERVRTALAVASHRCLDRALQQMRLGEQVARLARARLEGKAQSLEARAERLAASARRRFLDAERDRRGMAAAVARSARRSLEGQRRLPHDIAGRIAEKATAALARHQAVVEGLERLCQGLAPQRVLERGFSITRTADGTAVTAPDQVRSGDLLTTRTAGGSLRSRVEEP